MLLLSQIIAEHTVMPADDKAWLGALIREWHLLADTSFSDLVLWVIDEDDNVFWAGAQIRPNTGPTALEDEVVGDSIAYDPEHQVTEAYLSEVICETSNNQMASGIPVDVWAIPIMRDGRCIAIVERHTNRMGVRAPGALEECYLEVARVLSDMLWRGVFPLDPPSQASLSPKVGDGLVRLSNDGIVRYASPNAMSAFRRLGLVGDLEGEHFETVCLELATSDVLARAPLTDPFGRESLEVELDRPEASIRLRILPLTEGDEEAGTMVLCTDTTAVRDRERELVTKDATIREIHHRVKNNLQTVAALLRLQGRRISSPESKAALNEAMARVQSIAVVHEILSQAYDEVVVFDEVCDRILRMVGDVAAAAGTVRTHRDGTFGLVPADVATSLSLIITELCQNAIEHGLRTQSGVVTVRPQRTDDELCVQVIDDGAGLPDDFDMHAMTSLGMSIVGTLVADMDGTFTLDNGPTGGAVATVTIPLAQ